MKSEIIRNRLAFAACASIGIVLITQTAAFASTNFVQYIIPFTILHKNTTVWSSQMLFNNSEGISKAFSFSKSLMINGYPAVICNKKEQATTRTFKTVMLRNGFIVGSKLENSGKQITITIKALKAEPVTSQALSIMKKPASDCQTVIPKENIFIDRTIVTSSTDHSGSILLGAGYIFKYTIGTISSN